MLRLADLAADPARSGEVPPTAIPGLLIQLAALQTALAARMFEAPGKETAPNEVGSTDDGANWLTAQEAHSRSNLGVRWLYRHWQKVPGAKKFSQKRLRFHGRTFERWLKKGPCLTGPVEPSCSAMETKSAFRGFQ
jgi:hypothetical protein